MKARSIHFRVINLSLLFVACMVLLANLPHQVAPLLSWVNCGLYFFIFLQCFYVSLRDRYNRDVFVNIGLLCFVYSLSFVNVFFGDGFSLANNAVAIYVFQYRTIALRFLLALCIIYICVKFMFPNNKTAKNYLISVGVVMPAFLWHFYPYLLDINYLVSSPDYDAFDKRILYFTLFSFSSVCFYGYLLYRSEHSLGEHINSLVVCFFIMTLLDIADSIGYIYEIRLLSLSQYVLLIILSFFIITLVRKLNYLYSDFGSFYEHLVRSGNHLGIPIKRKKSTFALTFVTFFQAYFHQRRNFIAFIMFAFIFSLNYFNVSMFVKINLVTVTFGMFVLFFYLSALQHKRVSNGDLLAMDQSGKKKNAIHRRI